MSSASASVKGDAVVSTPTEKPPFVKGLAGVVAVQTEISSVDGPRSTLIYRGINIHELAERASYEEVVYLLLYGHLPSAAQLASFNERLAANRSIPTQIVDLFRAMPPDTVPMTALRTAVSALSFYDSEVEDISIEATERKAVRLIAQLPTLLATYQRIRQHQEPIPPNQHLSHAANTLYMLDGRTPDADFVAALNAYFVLLADHGMNASTFTARVVASTNADLHSAITSAMAALKGNLHGGANEATMRMLLEIGDVGRVDSYIDRMFAEKRKIMGFGHRIYKHNDPRARHLNHWAQHLGHKVNMPQFYEISLLVETSILRHREIYPNVDFYSASMLYYLGIPIDLFTPMFACSRVAGWSAHVIEQYKDSALIRPQSEYIGPAEMHYVPLNERS